MNLFNILHNTKSPKVYLYFITLQDGREVFIKIGISGFLHSQYASFKSYGYQVQEIAALQFSCKKDAINELNYLQELYKDHYYQPLHEFPYPENCYNIFLIEGYETKQYLHPAANILQEAAKMQIIESEEVKQIENIENNDNEQFANCNDLQIIEIKVISLLKTMKPSEVARLLNLPPYKITRIKKKYGH